MRKMPGWSRLQRALTERGSEMHTRALPSSDCTGTPDFRVPGVPHTTGALLEKVHGAREGIVSLGGLHAELCATPMAPKCHWSLGPQGQVPTRPGRMGASHMCLPSLVSLTWSISLSGVRTSPHTPSSAFTLSGKAAISDVWVKLS